MLQELWEVQDPRLGGVIVEKDREDTSKLKPERWKEVLAKKSEKGKEKQPQQTHSTCWSPEASKQKNCAKTNIFKQLLLFKYHFWKVWRIICNGDWLFVSLINR